MAAGPRQDGHVMTQRSGPNDPSDPTHWLDAGDASLST